MVKGTLFLFVSLSLVDDYNVPENKRYVRRAIKINNSNSPHKACSWLKNVSVVHVAKVQMFQVNIGENKII